MDNNETVKNNKEGQGMSRKSIINVVTLTLSIIAIVLSTFAIGSNVIGNNGKRPRTMAIQMGKSHVMNQNGIGKKMMNQRNATRSFMQGGFANRFGGFNGMMAANRKPRLFMQNNGFNNVGAFGRKMMGNNQGWFKNQIGNRNFEKPNFEKPNSNTENASKFNKENLPRFNNENRPNFKKWRQDDSTNSDTQSRKPMLPYNQQNG